MQEQMMPQRMAPGHLHASRTYRAQAAVLTATMPPLPMTTKTASMYSAAAARLGASTTFQQQSLLTGGCGQGKQILSGQFRSSFKNPLALTLFVFQHLPKSASLSTHN